jgi:hypothetical protein
VSQAIAAKFIYANHQGAADYCAQVLEERFGYCTDKVALLSFLGLASGVFT